MFHKKKEENKTKRRIGRIECACAKEKYNLSSILDCFSRKKETKTKNLLNGKYTKVVNL